MADPGPLKAGGKQHLQHGAPLCIMQAGQTRRANTEGRQKMSAKTITKEMPIGDVVKEHPETVPVFFKYGLHCIGCHVATWESIADGAAVHGIMEIDELILDLNRAVEEKVDGETEGGTAHESADQ